VLNLGLTRSQYEIYRATLASGYQLKTSVQILTPEHKVIRHLGTGSTGALLIDGQIDVTAPSLSNGEVEVSRVAHLTFLDPAHVLQLDSNTPTSGAFYMNRMVRVVCSVLCSFGWVDVPVFTGPIIKLDRDEAEVKIEAHGKEHYALGSAWTPDSFGGRRSDAMRAMMRKTGETDRYMSFPRRSGLLAKPVSAGRETHMWAKVWQTNAAMNRKLFYDGRGVAISRPTPMKTALHLRTGEGQMIVSPPKLSASTVGLKNAVYVVGAKPKKSKVPVDATWYPDNSNPLHPNALGRNGKPWFDGQFVNNPDLKTTAACRELAKTTGLNLAFQTVETPMETLPIYDLEPWDILGVSTPDYSSRIRAAAFSLPVVQRGADGTPMTIGSLQNLRKPVRR